MKRLSTKAFIIPIICFIIIESLSIVGLSQGATSSFLDPIGKIVSITYIVIGLLAVYTLVRDVELGFYLTILISVFQVIMGGFTLIKAYNLSYLNQASNIPVGIELTLGLLTFISIFMNTFNDKQNGSSSSPILENPDHRCAIELINVTKRYALDSIMVSAIDNINLKICKGEFIAIMGPSGSGKSTLLNLMGALDKPSSGQIMIDGVDISELDEMDLARLRNEKIGFVFQAYNLIARSTVLRNMELPALVKGYSKKERLKKVNALLDTVDLNDKVLRKPKTMSGGEQQRVAIARALINDPEIILADEPTGNVDSKTGLMIMGFLRKLNSDRGATIIVVTHDPEVAKMTDKIIYIRDGRILEEEIIGGVYV